MLMLMGAREGRCVQDDDGAQASGAFCQVVRVQSVHVPGDQRQFVVVLLRGFVSGGRTGSSQVYTAGFSECLLIFEPQCCLTFGLRDTGHPHQPWSRKSGRTIQVELLLPTSASFSSGCSVSLGNFRLQTPSPCPLRRKS